MRTSLFILAFVIGSSACRRTVVTTTSSTAVVAPDTLVAGTLINSAGTWSAHTSTSHQTLDVTISGTSVSWTFKNEKQLPGGGSSRGSRSSGMTLSSPGDPWFIYVESPKSLWFFNGSKELTYSLSDSEGSSDGAAIDGGNLLTKDDKIPGELVPHLPPDLQKLFPPPTPKEKRPSF